VKIVAAPFLDDLLGECVEGREKHVAILARVPNHLSLVWQKGRGGDLVMT